jgi:phage tail sheath gpL-like
MEFAAAVTALVALHGNIDPARPFQTLAISGVLPPAESDLFTISERNLLLFDGISTAKVASGGLVQIDRLVTTYQTNSAGAPDVSYLDVTTMLTLLYLRYSFRNRILTKYPRHKLANDGTRFGPGQAIVTPAVLKGEMCASYRTMERAGIVENFDLFKQHLVVERNVSDPTRVDVLFPPDYVNQLRVFALLNQFRLQYSEETA